METLYTQNNINELKNKGYTFIDNVLPIEQAKHLFNLFTQEKEWNHIEQIREHHYEHVFQSSNPTLPQPGECYIAKFSRSISLSHDQTLQKIYHQYITPLVKKVSPFELTQFDIKCHKQDIGDNFRVHMDDYAGSINSILYLNQEWKWDWGGILHVLSNEDEEQIESIFPKFNRLVLLNNKVFRAPHFINTVENFAKNPRYSIVSFNT